MQAHSRVGTAEGRAGGFAIEETFSPGNFLQEGPEQRHPVHVHFPPGQEHEQPPPLSAKIKNAHN